VRAYHGVLRAKGIPPHRPLEKDLELTDPAMRHDGRAGRRLMVAVQNNSLAAKPAWQGTSQIGPTPVGTASGDWPKQPDGSPDFMQMTTAQRRAYDHARLTRKFG
jgi:hypothetical protein